MDPYAIRRAYVLYIGAGAVTAGGIISLLSALPTIWHSFRMIGNSVAPIMAQAVLSVVCRSLESDHRLVAAE